VPTCPIAHTLIFTCTGQLDDEKRVKQKTHLELYAKHEAHELQHGGSLSPPHLEQIWAVEAGKGVCHIDPPATFMIIFFPTDYL
jgi:hypothetical protein